MLHPSISSWQPRCWARTGASLRQQCSRYLAAVTADYPLSSPLSANRRSAIISFLHIPLPFCGCFPFGQCFRFPILYFSDSPAHIPYLCSSITYCCSEVWAPALCPKDRRRIGWGVSVLPHSPHFSVLQRKRYLIAAAGVWASDTQNGVKGFSYLMTQFLQAKTPPMGNTE